MTIHTANLPAIVDAYLECAAWSSTHTTEDGEDTPLDEIDADWSKQAVEQAKSECADFVNYAEEQFGADIFDGLDAGQIGHDFWLTRNGHGAGFWDRGLGEQGEQLTKAAKTFGSSDAYIGDDGRIYLS